MDRSKLSRKIAVFVMALAFTVCMSGCENGKSDTGETTSETASKSEYSESSSENSAAESEKSERSTVSDNVTDTPVKSTTAPKTTTAEKFDVNQTLTTAKSTASEQENATAADITKKAKAEPEIPVITEPATTVTAKPVPTTESPTHGRDENELPGIDPFA